MKFDEWDKPTRKVNGDEIVKGRKRHSSFQSMPSSYFNALAEEERRERESREKSNRNETIPSSLIAKEQVDEDKVFERGDKVADKEVQTSKKKDFFDWRPWGVPKRYILGGVWFLATIATWFITHDTRKTMIVAISSPYFVALGLFFLSMISMVGMMILLSINEIIDEILPQKFRKIKWYVVIPLWATLPILAYVRQGGISGALFAFALVPIFVFMLLWFLGLCSAMICWALEFKNPLVKLIMLLVVLAVIFLMIMIGATSNGSYDDDYDQWDRRAPTYRRR